MREIRGYCKCGHELDSHNGFRGCRECNCVGFLSTEHINLLVQSFDFEKSRADGLEARVERLTKALEGVARTAYCDEPLCWCCSRDRDRPDDPHTPECLEARAAMGDR